jgi:hypothetical protein
LGYAIHAVKKNSETLIDADKQAGLEVNAEKPKYMLLARHQNAGQNHDIKKLTDHLKTWQCSNIWER